MRLYVPVGDADHQIEPYPFAAAERGGPLTVSSARVVLLWDGSDDGVPDWSALHASLAATLYTPRGTVCLTRNVRPIEGLEDLTSPLPEYWAWPPEQLLRAEVSYCAHWRRLLDAFPLSMS